VTELSAVKEEILLLFVAKAISEAVSIFLDIGTSAHRQVWQKRRKKRGQVLSAHALRLVRSTEELMLRGQYLARLTKVQSVGQLSASHLNRIF
jgi:hypothetical protein